MVLNSSLGQTNQNPPNIFVFPFFLPIIFIPVGSYFQAEACAHQVISLSCHVSAWVTAPAGTSLAPCASWDVTYRPAGSLMLSLRGAVRGWAKGLQHARLPRLGSHTAMHPPLVITSVSCSALGRENDFYLLTKHLENCFGPGLPFSPFIHMTSLST